jgi:hypothetical protein
MNEHQQVDALRPLPENRCANASLIVLADITADEDVPFNEWYNREHMRDRVLEFSSFVRGRRYVAIDGSPKYLALYDVRDVGVFSSKGYVSLVSDPDPRSRHFIPRFQNAYRTIARIDFAYGEGEGGALALWILEQSADGPSIPMLQEIVLQSLDMPGAVAAQVLSKDDDALATSSRRHVRQGNRIIERALIFETMDISSLRNVADRITGMLGSAAPRPALFQLLYRVSP